MNRKNNTTIGLDIAKNVFHYAELNRNGTVTGSGVLKRNKVLSHFAGLEAEQGSDGSLCRFALLGAAASGVWS